MTCGNATAKDKLYEFLKGLVIFTICVPSWLLFTNYLQSDPVAHDAVVNAADAFPASGSVDYARQAKPGVPLYPIRITDTSTINAPKVVSIGDAFQTPVARVYLRPGLASVIKLPAGQYYVLIAYGQRWHRAKKRFDDSASYYRGANLTVGNSSRDYQLDPDSTSHPLKRA